MSSIDLVILGIVLEKPQSAYDIQKDVEYHHFPRWTKISVPSIYRKVLQLSEKGYLQSDIVKGDKFADNRFIRRGKRFRIQRLPRHPLSRLPLFTPGLAFPAFHEEKPQRNVAIGELILQLIK